MSAVACAAHHRPFPPGTSKLGCFAHPGCAHRLLMTFSMSVVACGAHHRPFPPGTSKLGCFAHPGCAHRMKNKMTKTYARLFTSGSNGQWRSLKRAYLCAWVAPRFPRLRKLQYQKPHRLHPPRPVRSCDAAPETALLLRNQNCKTFFFAMQY